MDETQAHAMQYLALTDAMGYKAGPQELSPEEFAEALRRDAERYRWLRKSTVDSYMACGSHERLDAEIDEAMSGGSNDER